MWQNAMRTRKSHRPPRNKIVVFDLSSPARSSVLLLIAAAGCSQSQELPIFLSDAQVAIVSSVREGERVVSILGPENEGPLTVDSDPPAPIFTWILSTSDFHRADGSVPTTSELASLISSFDQDGGKDSCHHCTAQSASRPQLILPGDVCQVPQFALGAIWQHTGDQIQCGGSTDSELCSKGTAAQLALIESARRELWLQWPGACQCSGAAPSVSLAGIQVHPIRPESTPYPIAVFAQGPDGVIGGFHQGNVILFDPEDGIVHATPLTGFDGLPRAATSLSNGSFLLASTESLQEGGGNGARHDIFERTSQGLMPPLKVDEGEYATVRFRRVLDPEFPIYAMGQRSTRRATEPLIQACSAAVEECLSVSIDCSQDQSNFVIDLVQLSNGAAIALGDRGVYYRRGPGSANLSPDDTWLCDSRPAEFPVPGGPRRVRIERFLSLGARGDTVFACGLEELQECAEPRAVIIAASVSPGSAPDWQVVFEGSDLTYCREFVDVAEDPSRIRVSLHPDEFIDFDESGSITSTKTAMEAYGFEEVESVFALSPGSTLLRLEDNQLFYQRPTGEIQPIAGEPMNRSEDFGAVVAMGPAEFLALRGPQGFIRIGVNEVSGQFPAVNMEVVRDLEGAFDHTFFLEAAVIDSEASARAAAPVLLVGGRRGESAYLARVSLADDGFRGPTEVTLPDPAGSGVRNLVEVKAGEFIAATDDSRLLRIRDGVVTEVELDFDDPDTEFGEIRPVLDLDQCIATRPRLDLFTVLQSKEGITWVAGDFGVVFRIIDGRAERFSLPSDSIVLSADLLCGDEGIFAGRVNHDGVRRQWIWHLTHTPSGSDMAPLRDLEFRDVGESEILGTGINELIRGEPLGVSIEASSSADPQLTIVLERGLVYRPFDTASTTAVRTPFRPVRSVTRSDGGYLLIVGWGGQLALGASP